MHGYTHFFGQKQQKISKMIGTREISVNWKTILFSRVFHQGKFIKFFMKAGIFWHLLCCLIFFPNPWFMKEDGKWNKQMEWIQYMHYSLSPRPPSPSPLSLNHFLYLDFMRRPDISPFCSRSPWKTGALFGKTNRELLDSKSTETGFQKFEGASWYLLSF